MRLNTSPTIFTSPIAGGPSAIRAGIVCAVCAVCAVAAIALGALPGVATAANGPVAGEYRDPSGSGVAVSDSENGGNRVSGYSGRLKARHLGLPSTVDTMQSDITFVDCSGLGVPSTGTISVKFAPTFHEDKRLHAPELSSIQAMEPAQITVPVDGGIYDPANPPQTYFAVCRTTTPGFGTRPGSPQALAQAIDFAKQYLRRVPLPSPAPKISAENGGICGVTHSLDLQMEPEFLYTEDTTPFGAFGLHVYANTSVNWGDGTQNTYTDAGAPWPASDIKHFWSESGTFNIAATSNWVASFTLGPYEGFTYRGLLTGIATRGELNDFKVWDTQAVLTQ